MGAREIPEPFLPLSSTSSYSLQPPASSPIAQFHYDGYGSDSVSDRDRGPSHLTHPAHQFPLGLYTPRGPVWDQNPSPYAHSRALGVTATVDVAENTFGPTDTSIAPLALEFAQAGPAAAYEATFQHPGAVLHPRRRGRPLRRRFLYVALSLSDSASAYLMLSQTGYGDGWTPALQEVGGYRAGGFIPAQGGISIHEDTRCSDLLSRVYALQFTNKPPDSRLSQLLRLSSRITSPMGGMI